LPLPARELLALARERFGASEFAAAELERVAGISRSSALGALRALAAAGLLARSGAGSATRYRAVG
jgi:DNA-binding IclR family transcriptional regulator